MLYEMCRKFADEELAPNAREWDQKHEFPTNAITQLVRYVTVLYCTVAHICGCVV
jgi:alkylation response protein AidB-like acyl-CoA dehydrogenase